MAAYDALFFLSFGGPEGPDDVMPFLRNVTRDRGIPEERLAAVAEHYLHFGGVSPINEQNRQLISALEKEFLSAGIDLPIYFGNRNWAPYAAEAVRHMRDDGVRRALVFATSATSSFSGCRQYRNDMAQAQGAVGGDAPELVKIRHYFDHPGFIAANADGVRAALAELPPEHRDAARLVFTAHSIPVAMNAGSGPGHDGLYARQQWETARLVASAVRGGRSESGDPPSDRPSVDRPSFDRPDFDRPDFDLVWQSRSGPPQVPWLEPDINDHLRALAASGTTAVVVAPTGFISDHLEVRWDLDTEARETAGELGLAFARAATAGTHPVFVAAIRELVEEQLDGAPPRHLGNLGLCGIDCPAQCCPAPPRPAR